MWCTFSSMPPDWCKAIICSNTGLLSIGHSGTSFNEILFQMQTFHSRKCLWKCHLRKWWPFCLGLNVSNKVNITTAGGVSLCISMLSLQTTLWWCHNGHDRVSNHQPHYCLLNRLFRRRSKETSTLCVTGLWAGEFPAQMASNVETVSIWWRHHEYCTCNHAGLMSLSLFDVNSPVSQMRAPLDVICSNTCSMYLHCSNLTYQ